MTWTKEHIHLMLDSKPIAVVKAIQAIHARQTSDEQAMRVTKEKNGVGFSSNDAEFMSSLCEFYAQRGFLTPKQLAIGRNRIKRYWRQLIEVANDSGKQPPAEQLPNAAMTAARIGPDSDWS